MIRLVTFFGVGKAWASFQGGMICAKSVGKLKLFVKNIGKFRSTGFENYFWKTTRAFRFRGVKLEKGLADFSCGEFYG